MAKGVRKAANKKSASMPRKKPGERFVIAADVLADALERLGDKRVRISRKRRHNGPR
jgi:hypothetical protein